MTTVIERIELILSSSAKGAIAGLKETEAASTSLDKSTGKLGTAFDQLGISGGAALKVGIAGAAVAAGAAVVKFALDGISKFADLTGQTRSLRNVMGGTAEDASRIAGASRALGLDVDTVSKGFFQLTRRIAANKDTLAENGIQIARNNDGSVNMAKTLVNVSEGYLKITDPAERNLFLMQNFGKAGAALIPLLAQGKDKLAEFYAQTAKHGEVFSEADLEKGRQYKIAVNELNQAWEGFSADAGREVIPVLTKIVRFAEADIVAIRAVIGAVSDFFGSLDPNGNFERGWHTIFGGASHEIEQVGFSIGNVSEKFAGLSTTKATQTFLDLGVEAAKSGLSVYGTNQHLLDFIQLARQDVGVAAQVIQGLKERGVNTDMYERALKNVAGQQLQNIEMTQRQKDANVLLTGSFDDQIKVLDKEQDALLAQYDKGFAAVHASESLSDAMQTLTDKRQAAADAGGQDAAANDASTRAMFAAEEQAIRTAAAIGQKAESDHQGEGAAAAHKAGIDAQIQTLQGLAQTLSPDDPLRVFLEQYIGRLQAVPPDASTIFSTPGLDDALNKVVLYKESLDQIGYGFLAGPTPLPPGVAAPGRAAGGPVSAGQLYRVNELGMEYFRPSMSGAILPLGATSGTAPVTKTETNYWQITEVQSAYDTAREVARRRRAEQFLSSRL